MPTEVLSRVTVSPDDCRKASRTRGDSQRDDNSLIHRYRSAESCFDHECDVAIGIYSVIASGMIALTGLVFSFAFVMVQFSATAYSPRPGLVLCSRKTHRVTAPT